MILLTTRLTGPNPISSDDNQPIYVTQPFLPEIAELLPDLEQIWENQHRATLDWTLRES